MVILLSAGSFKGHFNLELIKLIFYFDLTEIYNEEWI